MEQPMSLDGAFASLSMAVARGTSSGLLGVLGRVAGAAADAGLFGRPRAVRADYSCYTFNGACGDCYNPQCGNCRPVIYWRCPDGANCGDPSCTQTDVGGVCC